MPHALLLSSWYPPSPGGAEAYAGRLARLSADNGWTTTVVTDGRVQLPAGARLDAETRVHRLTTYASMLSDRRRVAWRTMQFGLLHELDNAMAGAPPVDLVHANSMETAVLGRMVADTVDVPLVATVHEHAPQAQPFGVGRCRLVFGRLAPDAVIAPSTFYRNRALAEGVDPSRVHLIPHGIEVPPAPPSRPPEGYGAAWGFPQDSRVVLFVGRIYQPKGVLELIRAAALLRREDPRARVVVLGPDGPSEYADAVRAEATRLGLDGFVRFIGPRSPAATLDAMERADALAAPSLAEGFGLAVAEAMVRCRPVVAARVGGLLDLIDDGRDGVLVPPCDPVALAAALSRVLADPALAARLGTAARDKVLRRHTAAAMVAETTALYNELIVTGNRTMEVLP